MSETNEHVEELHPSLEQLIQLFPSWVAHVVPKDLRWLAFAIWEQFLASSVQLANLLPNPEEIAQTIGMDDNKIFLSIHAILKDPKGADAYWASLDLRSGTMICSGYMTDMLVRDFQNHGRPGRRVSKKLWYLWKIYKDMAGKLTESRRPILTISRDAFELILDPINLEARQAEIDAKPANERRFWRIDKTERKFHLNRKNNKLTYQGTPGGK